ncbi:MAG: hypothetical protein KF787_10340 [Phycisphaeraceae bacterium]|nr:hypothetical protein [Phycisphaerae bacterium]MBX3393033.1 hypothetical protein [Phycisphaeraceae bacterium]HRJ50101.1 hypothetical protein [Phycisphaerales bacterium]
MRLWNLIVPTTTYGCGVDSCAPFARCRGSGECWGRWTGLSVLDPAWERLLGGELLGADPCRGETYVATSDVGEGTSSAGEEIEARRPWRRWGEEVRRGFDEALSGLVSRASQRGAAIAVTTAADGVVCDVPSMVRFCSRHARHGEPGAAGLIVEPAGMIDGAMLGDAAEHLARIYGAALGMAGARAVVVSNLRRTWRAGVADVVEVCDVGEGELEPGVIVDALKAALGAGPGVACENLVVRGDVGLVESLLWE